MSLTETRAEPPASRNPIHNANRLKLGIFMINGDGGAHTTIAERFHFSWDNSLAVAMAGDAAGFEAIVPYARYHALVSPDHRTGHVFDNLTWTAAVAARTSYSCIMTTLQVMNFHPIVAAKSVATIDAISNGRFGLNIVCGWFDTENQMFGYTDNPDRTERYAYADEWISVMKRLWGPEDAFDHEGRYFHLKSAMSQPKPIQQPWPPLMNAGGSAEGQDFVARQCDLAFVQGDSFDDLRDRVDAYRALARAQGRQIQVWTYCAIVQGDTDADAERFIDYCAQNADEAFMSDWIRNRKIAPEVEQQMRRKYAAAGPAQLISGDAAGIADQLQTISDCGADGVLMTWVDAKDGVDRFAREVIPLLEEKGLRQPFRKGLEA